ncbi:MAG TPA: T9SS type A sorting domain-containing protein [Cytophagaceae bacterium]|jgi:hypothetical protein
MIKKTIFLLLLIILVKGLTFGQSSSSIRTDGTLLVDGKPFFPFGFYGVGFRDTYANKIASIDAVSESRFNTIVFEDISTYNFGGLLDRAAELGNVKVLVGLGSTETQSETDIYVTNSVNSHKNKSALLGWSVADDADDGRFSISDLTHRNNLIKSNDNKHVTFATLTGWDASRRNKANSFTTITDVSGYQCYPIGAHRNSDWTSTTALSQTYLRTLAYVQSAALVNRPMIMTLQTFSWGEQSDNPRYPTVGELRNMLYTSIAAGVKGVISYDFSFDLKNNQPALWSELKSLTGDVKSIQTMLLDGKLTRTSSADAELVSSYWESADTCLVVLANTTYNKNKTVSLSLPSKYAKYVMTPMFNRMSSSLTYFNGVLSGSLKNQEVEVYKFTPGLTTSIDVLANKVIYTIHPNPASAELFVGGNFAKNGSYEIISMEGIHLQTGRLSQVINLRNLNPALYIIKIRSDEGESIHRFVKE